MTSIRTANRRRMRAKLRPPYSSLRVVLLHQAGTSRNRKYTVYKGRKGPSAAYYLMHEFQKAAIAQIAKNLGIPKRMLSSGPRQWR